MHQVLDPHREGPRHRARCQPTNPPPQQTPPPAELAPHRPGREQKDPSPEAGEEEAKSAIRANHTSICLCRKTAEGLHVTQVKLIHGSPRCLVRGKSSGSAGRNRRMGIGLDSANYNAKHSFRSEPAPSTPWSWTGDLRPQPRDGQQREEAVLWGHFNCTPSVAAQREVADDNRKGEEETPPGELRSRGQAALG